MCVCAGGSGVGLGRGGSGVHLPARSARGLIEAGPHPLCAPRYCDRVNGISYIDTEDQPLMHSIDRAVTRFS